jgi:3-hydroxyacyl-[acyl-carrier-protein] dehydratase
MNGAMSEEAARVFRDATKGPLVSLADRGREPILDREAIQSVLPHRDPFLLVDQVTALDLERGTIVARYDLSRARRIFAGHFPDHPLWPGVLQVEAIGQAGIILYLKREEVTEPSHVTLTHIAGARFMRPVGPGGDVEILARVLDDGLFFAVVGQCLQNGNICSIAAVTILH